MKPLLALAARLRRDSSVERLERATPTDLRLQAFSFVFGIGIICHEVQFLLEQQRIAALGSYLEQWAQVKPTIGWPSPLVIAMHLAAILTACALVRSPGRLWLFGLLNVLLLVKPFTSPDRVPAHDSVILATTLQLLGLAALGRALGPRGGDWRAWLRTGLRVTFVLTYFFAAFSKLNSGWLAPERSRAPDVLVGLVAPLIRLFGLPLELAEMTVAPVAIWGTIAVELLLPPLVIWPPTALAGCLVGLNFHLPMMIQRVFDFPTLILAFYPLFLSEAQLRSLLQRIGRRPSPGLLLASLAFGAYLIVGMMQADARMAVSNTELLDSPLAHPLLVRAYQGLGFVLLPLVGYVTLAVAAELFSPAARQKRRVPGWNPEVEPAPSN